MGMEKQTTDAHLIRAYLSGKDHAFEKLFRRYERPLFSFILRFVGIREGILQCFREKAYREVRQTLSLTVC